MDTVRPPVLAGTWYPEDPRALRRQVEGFLAGAVPDEVPGGAPVVALSPHAGFTYSGATAGRLFGALAGRRFDAVFILAPSHRAALERPAVSGATAFATPLGEVPVDRDIVAELTASGFFVIDDRAHAVEHAVEIQLPLLQCALPDGTPIVPVLVPPLSERRREQAAAVLERWRDGRHLFLVSSDLTHYGASYGYLPFTDDIPARLEQLDTGALLKFLAHDGPGLLDYGRRTGITMCGLEAAALALAGSAPAGHLASLLGYARSGDRDGDYSLSVSYAAAVICDPAAAAATPDHPDEPDTAAALTPAERAFLVELATRAVDAAVRGHAAPDPAALAARAGLALSPRLDACRGAFVTLTSDGMLRGCIGYIEGVGSLADAVVDNGRAAALRDPRFDPVTEGELPHLAVEVSALTPLRPVDGPDDIEIGRHGIVLSRGGRRAVFLPQVAPEQGWDRDTTLRHLALKAGLPADAWREGCRFHVFEAEICS
jgi:AmmeMemoRadiSam system protein B/AmmeMemoRadiSam system protein A